MPKNDNKIWATKLFEKLSTLFALKYKDIQSLLPFKSLDQEDRDVESLAFDATLLSEYINHPVHIINNNQISPSAFIPFCDFGGNMSTMGVKIDQFDVPVCNSFQARILNDQLCYEVDLNKFSDRKNIAKDLKLGFYFLMDYSEDRQVTFDKTITKDKEISMANNILKSDEDQHTFIYLNTIGRYDKSLNH